MKNVGTFDRASECCAECDRWLDRRHSPRTLTERLRGGRLSEVRRCFDEARVVDRYRPVEVRSRLPVMPCASAGGGAWESEVQGNCGRRRALPGQAAITASIQGIGESRTGARRTNAEKPKSPGTQLCEGPPPDPLSHVHRYRISELLEPRCI